MSELIRTVETATCPACAFMASARTARAVRVNAEDHEDVAHGDAPTALIWLFAQHEYRMAVQ